MKRVEGSGVKRVEVPKATERVRVELRELVEVVLLRETVLVLLRDPVEAVKGERS